MLLMPQTLVTIWPTGNVRHSPRQSDYETYQTRNDRNELFPAQGSQRTFAVSV